MELNVIIILPAILMLGVLVAMIIIFAKNAKMVAKNKKKALLNPSPEIEGKNYQEDLNFAYRLEKVMESSNRLAAMTTKFKK